MQIHLVGIVHKSCLISSSNIFLVFLISYSLKILNRNCRLVELEFNTNICFSRLNALPSGMHQSSAEESIKLAFLNFMHAVLKFGKLING